MNACCKIGVALDQARARVAELGTEVQRSRSDYVGLASFVADVQRFPDVRRVNTGKA